MPDATRKPTDPYCSHCGYSLIGLEDSSKCPECGKPLVEVLVRDSFPGITGRRYQSPQRLFGLPLLAIASGPYRDEKVGRPVGIIAIGDQPRGFIAIGGASIGVFAFGGLAVGGVTFGGLSIGLLSMGGFSVGGVAFGGFACGLYAVGGIAYPILRGAGGMLIRPFSWW